MPQADETPLGKEEGEGVMVSEASEVEKGLDVQFEIHGAACHTCGHTIHGLRLQEDDLKPFVEEHGTHDGLAWICVISSPPEFAGPREFEMKFSKQAEGLKA